MQQTIRILLWGMGIAILYAAGRQANAQGVMAALVSAQQVSVRLDTCGDGPLGGPGSSLQCGGYYSIQYRNISTAPSCALVIGPSALDPGLLKDKVGKQVEYCEPLSDPRAHQINLWGRIMTYTDDGVVLDRDPPNPPVGHIVVVPASPPAASGPSCLCVVITSYTDFRPATTQTRPLVVDSAQECQPKCEHQCEIAREVPHPHEIFSCVVQ
jgi:hypothetical protein